MAQSASSVVPSRVAYKSSVRINGTGLSGVTNVKFGTISGSVTSSSATQLVVAVPTTLTSGSHNIVINDVATALNINYVAPSNTPANASVNRVISDFGGYWNSTAVSSVASQQPDTRHNMLAFGFGNKILRQVLTIQR